MTKRAATIITDQPGQDLSLLRLLQLSSASLPVGGYSFSQGLEYAIDSGWVKNETQVADWISCVMQHSMANVDLPLLQRLLEASKNNDATQFTYWNAYSLACRETTELRLTETAMGEALLRLLRSLAIPLPAEPKEVGFISTFAVAAVHWNVDAHQACVGYLWSWLENQIAAATKIVPLGQTSAQQLLLELGEDVGDIIETSKKVTDDNIGVSLPGLAMASSWHETQYSRLFRS